MSMQSALAVEANLDFFRGDSPSLLFSRNYMVSQSIISFYSEKQAYTFDP